MNYRLPELCKRGAAPTMALLLGRIEKRSTATYGEIARYLQKELDLGEHPVFPIHIGHVAGYIMDAIQKKYADAPLINTLVVAQEGLPSKGSYSFIERRLGIPKGSFAEKPNSTRRDIIRNRIWQEVFNYSEWDSVFENVFGHTAGGMKTTSIGRLTERDGGQAGWGGYGGGESEEHKRLKEFVLKNPHCVHLEERTIKKRQTEQKLMSGDKVDVLFSTSKASVLVEVKSALSSEGDFERGIYQCLKYRTVFAAQLGEYPPSDDFMAIMVTERELPRDLVKLAKRLKVHTFVVSVNKGESPRFGQ